MVDSQHYVRIIDLFVDNYLQEDLILNHEKGQKDIGRKAYHPSMMIKLYMYCYLNSISSSRKIEKECHRKIEVIWLTGNLKPDHKTISDFRKSNTESISYAFKRFSNLLKEHNCISGNTISIDGSKIRANAGMCISLSSISSRLEDIEAQLQKYLEKIENADHLDDDIENVEQEKEKLEQQVEELKEEIEELREQRERLEEEGVKRLSPTDKDCRIMKSRNGLHFCYNLLSAVDSKYQFISDTFLSNHETDRRLLIPMVDLLKNQLNIVPKELLADAGYYRLMDIEQLEKQENINCFVAINSNQILRQQKKGIDFTYDTKKDVYTCTEGKELFPINGIKRDRKRKTEVQAYIGKECSRCQKKPDCTKSRNRLVYRHINNQWREEYENKLKSSLAKEKLKQRKALSEHPFGTIKYWMGQIPLKVRGKEKVQAETNLYALCYNSRR